MFILRRLQEEYQSKGNKLCILTGYQEVLEWTIRMKGISEVLVRSVMKLYEGAKMKVGVNSDLSEEFEVNVHQGSVVSPFLFAVVVDVVIELAR